MINLNLRKVLEEVRHQTPEFYHDCKKIVEQYFEHGFCGHAAMHGLIDGLIEDYGLDIDRNLMGNLPADGFAVQLAEVRGGGVQEAHVFSAGEGYAFQKVDIW